jgi:guanine deaminase
MGMNAANQNVPANLRTSVKISSGETMRLFDKWNGAGGGLLSYCFTVRPAYCASRSLLATTARLANTMGASLQCHLSEDKEGQRYIIKAFPPCRSDTDVYREVGLLGDRTIMAHGIYLSGFDLGWLRDSGTALIHCPRANLMAGGKQFQLKRAKRSHIKVGLGTDLGGAKGLSMFKTMEDAMKVTTNLSIHETIRLATIEGAITLGLSDRIGTLEVGKEADFLVVSPRVSRGLDSRFLSIDDLLSSLVFRGNDRDVKLVSVKGRIVKQYSMER